MDTNQKGWGKNLNWQKAFGLFGVIIFFSLGVYSFCSSEDVQVVNYATFSQAMPENGPMYNFIISFTTKDEFIAGQSIHVDAYVLFTNEDLYNDQDPNNRSILVFAEGAVPSKSEDRWFESAVIQLSETKEPINKNLKDFPAFTDKYLVGSSDVVFQTHGSHEVYTLSNGKKVPLTTINISPRTSGYDIINNRRSTSLALIAISFTLFSFILEKKSKDD